jgi:hypothetical protein
MTHIPMQTLAQEARRGVFPPAKATSAPVLLPLKKIQKKLLDGFFNAGL